MRTLRCLALTMAVLLGMAGLAQAAGMITVFASAQRTSSVDSSAIDLNPNAPFTGLKCFLDVSAASGTLDVKLQEQDPLTDSWVDISGASFSQKTATANDTLLIAPGVTEANNRKVDDVVASDWRASATLGNNPDFTFALACVPLGPIQAFR